MSKLNIAEQFYTLQGEGEFVGVPSVFLRLAGCNLACGATETPLQEVDEDHEPDGDATWRCDTIEVWREASESLSPEETFEVWQEEGWIDHIRSGAHIVLTGGEPTLPTHQEAFVGLYAEFIKEDVVPFVEVETNGTIVPSDTFDRYVDQYNVSVKLANSGHQEDVRRKEDAIQWHADNRTSSTFKFVVSRQEDIEEVKEIQEQFSIPSSQILLMPAGQNQSQLSETYPSVAELCKQEGYRFSQRLHVELWNEKTGV